MTPNVTESTQTTATATASVDVLSPGATNDSGITDMSKYCL